MTPAEPSTGASSRGLTRRSLVLAALAGGAGVVGGYALAGRRAGAAAGAGPTVTTAERHAAQPEALFRIPTTEPIVALTFDDGPDPLYTPAVLDLLADRGMSATFFLVGANAAAEPELVRRILDGGHGIGNHTQDHRSLDTLTAQQVRVEIQQAHDALIAAGCPEPDLFRPPRGRTNAIVGTLADSYAYRTVFWDACVEHFVNHQPVAAGVEQMVSTIRPGSIILAHDGGRIVGSESAPLSRARTIEALPDLLDRLTERGLRVVDVATLLQATGTPALAV
ncbi:polysaccharide deacetylase family protein [Cellulomonas alba]|uniref:Polysaccharide deacetylase family protein n=1 Tax=Cellulomonas alba TaxID=3053467 RepID=A0ABT7SIM0_9CELL|nr:polysaccharide deacetylase family protein [Cellulomonas alba]MDM7856020.1 polysaccharide deacetylase family protein [Cellulomonas alba]